MLTEVPKLRSEENVTQIQGVGLLLFVFLQDVPHLILTSLPEEDASKSESTILTSEMTPLSGAMLSIVTGKVESDLSLLESIVEEAGQEIGLTGIEPWFVGAVDMSIMQQRAGKLVQTTQVSMYAAVIDQEELSMIESQIEKQNRRVVPVSLESFDSDDFDLRPVSHALLTALLVDREMFDQRKITD